MTTTTGHPDAACTAFAARAGSCSVRRWLSGRPCCDCDHLPGEHNPWATPTWDAPHAPRSQAHPAPSDVDLRAGWRTWHARTARSVPLGDDRVGRSTATATEDRGTCGHCPASADGCRARQAFALGERCCRRCTHPAPDLGPRP